MDITKENFPLYKHLVDMNAASPMAVADFEAAQKGGDEEKFHFVHGIQTVAANAALTDIPGFTAEMRDKTLESCFAVYTEVASHGHQTAAVMVENFKARGLGQPKKSASKTKRFKNPFRP